MPIGVQLASTDILVVERHRFPGTLAAAVCSSEFAITPVPLIYSFKGQFRLLHDQLDPLGPILVSLGQNWVFSEQPELFRDYNSMEARMGGVALSRDKRLLS